MNSKSEGVDGAERKIDKYDRWLLSRKGKIILQVWYNFSGTPKGEYPSKKLKKMIKTWKTKNPDWYHVLLNKDNGRDIMKEFYPEFLSLYEGYPNEIQRVDAIRYFFLHRYGGFYADADTRCVVSLSKALKGYDKDLYLVESSNCILDYSPISNSIMYSRKPNHAFWNIVHNDLKNNSEKQMFQTRHIYIMESTGPIFLSNLYKKHKDKLLIEKFPKESFNPCNTCGVCKYGKNVFMIHNGDGSWEESDSTTGTKIYCNSGIILFMIASIVIVYGFTKIKKKSTSSRGDESSISLSP